MLVINCTINGKTRTLKRLSEEGMSREALLALADIEFTWCKRVADMDVALINETIYLDMIDVTTGEALDRHISRPAVSQVDSHT